MRTIEPLDVHDDAAFRAFHGAYARCHDRDFDQPYGAAEKRVNLASDEYGRHQPLVVREDGALVGGGWIEMPLRDNLAFGYVFVFVLPGHRRRGHGSAVVEEIVRLAREHGRTILHGEVVWGVDETVPPVAAFAGAHGFELDILDAVRELPLPATLPSAPTASGYAVLGWRECPEEWLEEYAHLRHLLVQEAPSGDAGLENEFWDAARLRHEERQWREQGRVAQTAVAVAPDGGLAGHTQLLFPDDSAEVHQWDTLVQPAHRGHGLGLALKVHAMREAADLLAGRRRVSTWNAAENTPMIGVNEAMGYRQTAWGGEYVRRL